MTDPPISEMNEQQLRARAGSGLQGQDAIVESMRRLRVAVEQLEHTTIVLTRWLIAFTVILVGLTGALAYVAFRG